MCSLSIDGACVSFHLAMAYLYLLFLRWRFIESLHEIRALNKTQLSRDGVYAIRQSAAGRISSNPCLKSNGVCVYASCNGHLSWARPPPCPDWWTRPRVYSTSRNGWHWIPGPMDMFSCCFFYFVLLKLHQTSLNDITLNQKSKSRADREQQVWKR